MQTSKMICCIALAALAFQSAETKAQETPQVNPGDRVRVTAPDCELRKQIGVLASLDRDLFTAALGGVDIQCPTRALTRLEVSLGERRWWKTSLKGMGIGAGAGLVVGLAVLSADESTDGLRGLAALFFLPPIGAILGFGVGTIHGVTRGTDKWEQVPLPLVQPSLFVSGGSRLNLGISIPLRR